MTRTIRRLCVLLPLLAGVRRADAGGVDWPNFRGPRYDGISTETGFRKATTEPLKLVWEANVGSAFSSFAIVKGRVYTCGMAAGRQVLMCLDAETGAVLWRNPFEAEYRNEHGDGTRATPTFDGERVYILGAHGRLLCVNAGTGADVWERKLNHRPTWAYSGSVLIERDLAIVSAGGTDGSLAAFDKATGEPVWKTGHDPVGYATPYLFTMDGKRLVAGFLGNSVIIADAKTGRQMWRTPWKTDWEVNASMPIFHDGHLFLTSGYRTGSALLKLTSSGDSIRAEEVWRSKVLLNKFQSCILYDGYLYASDQKGFKCVDFKSGSEQWKIPRVKHGTLVLADEHLLLLTEDGELRIGVAQPSGFTPSMSAKILTGRCWSVPVLYDGRIYARNLTRVVCFNLR